MAVTCWPSTCGGMAQPDELAVIVAYLHGELLHGFCRLVQKALEARHG